MSRIKPPRPTSGAPWRPWVAHPPGCSAARSTAARASRDRWRRSRTAARRFSCAGCACSTHARSREGDPVIPPQELVERALSSADALGADGCIVLVEDSSHVDVRYALNTTTTNGEQRGRSVSVIALCGESVGSARRSGEVGADGVADMAAAALADAREAPPATDAFPLVEPSQTRPARDFGLDPEE